jgi:hypothetical protein
MKRANVFLIAIIVFAITYIFGGNSLEGESWQTILGYAIGVLIGVFVVALIVEFALSKFRK